MKKIENFEKKHLDGVEALEKECFHSPWTREGLEEEIENDGSHFLVLTEDESVIGYIGVKEICSEAYITDLAVTEPKRRCGSGSLLLKAAIDGAKERQCDFITLEVRESNLKAISLYEKSGFNYLGKRKNFYTNPAEDALIYTLYFRDSL